MDIISRDAVNNELSSMLHCLYITVWIKHDCNIMTGQNIVYLFVMLFQVLLKELRLTKVQIHDL